MEGWEVERRGRRAEAASSTVLDHLQRASIPTERLDSSVERGREKGGVYEGRERGKDRGDTRQGESVKRERKEVVWVITSFPLSFSLPLFLSLPGMHALALHAVGYTEMIYLCARAGRHGKSGPHKGVVVPPWSFL